MTIVIVIIIIDHQLIQLALFAEVATAGAESFAVPLAEVFSLVAGFGVALLLEFEREEEEELVFFVVFETGDVADPLLIDD